MVELIKRINKKFIFNIFLFELIGTLSIYTIFILLKLDFWSEISFFFNCLILLIFSIFGAVFSYYIYENNCTCVSTYDYVISILLYFIFGTADAITSIMQIGIHTSIAAFWIGLSHLLNLNLIIFRLDKKFRENIGMPDSKVGKQFLNYRLIHNLKAWAYIGILLMSIFSIVNLFHPFNFLASFSK